MSDRTNERVADWMGGQMTTWMDEKKVLIMAGQMQFKNAFELVNLSSDEQETQGNNLSIKADDMP